MILDTQQAAIEINKQGRNEITHLQSLLGEFLLEVYVRVELLIYTALILPIGLHIEHERYAKVRAIEIEVRILS